MTVGRNRPSAPRHEQGGDTWGLRRQDRARSAKRRRARSRKASARSTDNERLEAEGQADQAAANVKQAGDNVADAAKKAFEPVCGCRREPLRQPGGGRPRCSRVRVARHACSGSVSGRFRTAPATGIAAICPLTVTPTTADRIANSAPLRRHRSAVTWSGASDRPAPARTSAAAFIGWSVPCGRQSCGSPWTQCAEHRAGAAVGHHRGACGNTSDCEGTA